MQNIKKIPELLAPAGNFDCLRGAIQNGADAVYFGGQDFNARNSAENFTMEQLKEAIDFCHLHSVKAYITINTLYKNAEIAPLFEFIGELYSHGADAFIVSDVGVAMQIKQLFPNIRLHASTQMSISDANSATFLAKNGFDRVILARESSLKDIEQVVQTNIIETEVFVHGALCVCHSGHCLMSSVLGARSGNRGKCAQTCRLNYDIMKDNEVIKSGYLLSPRDIMTLEILPQIIVSGVHSLKIEGRMKNAEYVSLATKLYREQLTKIADGNPFVSTRDLEQIGQVFNRGGKFTTGYFENHSGIEMLSTQTPKSLGLLVGVVSKYNPQTKHCVIDLTRDLFPGDGIEIKTDKEPHVGTNINKNHCAKSQLDIDIEGNISPTNLVYRSFDKQLSNELKQLYGKMTRKTPINCDVTAKVGQKLSLKFYNDNVNAEIFGDVVDVAQNQPLTTEKLLAQVKKSGDTPFSVEVINAEIDENIFIGVSALNSLRRDGLDMFFQRYVQFFRREVDLKSVTPIVNPPNKNKLLNISVKNVEQLGAVLASKVNTIYVDATKEFLENIHLYVEKARDNGILLYAAFPHFQNNISKEIAWTLEHSEIDGYLFGNFGQLETFAQTEKDIALNHEFNVYNELSVQYLSTIANVVTLSPELNLMEIKQIATEKCEIIVHGRLPLMTTRQCPVGIFAGQKGGEKFCKLRNNSDNYSLKDRKNVTFPLETDCQNCVATILNSQVLFTLNKFENLINTNVGFLRLSFTTENALEVAETTQAYAEVLANVSETSEKTAKLIDNYLEMGITNGHFYRGVL